MDVDFLKRKKVVYHVNGNLSQHEQNLMVKAFLLSQNGHNLHHT